MTRQQFESSIVKAPEQGALGEVVFDFRNVSNAVMPEFRHSTCYEWDGHGVAMDECWMAYLNAAECDWTD